MSKKTQDSPAESNRPDIILGILANAAIRADLHRFADLGA